MPQKAAIAWAVVATSETSLLVEFSRIGQAILASSVIAAGLVGCASEAHRPEPVAQQYPENYKAELLQYFHGSLSDPTKIREASRSRRRSVDGTLVVITHGLVYRALVERHALLPEAVVVPEPRSAVLLGLSARAQPAALPFFAPAVCLRSAFEFVSGVPE